MPKGPKVPRPIASIFTVEESWQKLINEFTYARWHEGPDNIANIKKLVKVLRAEVEAARDDADRMMREQKPTRPSLKVRLIEAGFGRDPAANFDYRIITNQTKTFDPTDPQGVRDYAAFIKDMSINIHLITLESQKRFREGRKGRPQSFAMERLLKSADRMNVSDGAVAKHLAAADLRPEGPGSEETNLMEQWLVVIKAARYRRRKRPG